MKDIAKNIRDLRSRKNMTQDELAEKLFVTRQTVSNYETGKSRPDVEMLARIAEALDTDVNSLIYGPSPTEKNTEKKRLALGAGATILTALLYGILYPVTKRIFYSRGGSWFLSVLWILGPLALLCAGWTLTHLTGMALKQKPLEGAWARRTGILLLTVLLLLFTLTLWQVAAMLINDFLYANRIRGEWITLESTNTITGITESVPGWNRLPDPAPEWVKQIVSWTSFNITQNHFYVYLLLGSALWILGIPKQKTQIL